MTPLDRTSVLHHCYIRFLGSGQDSEDGCRARATILGCKVINPLTLVGRFVLRTILGVLLFALVGVAAIILNYCAGLVAQFGVSKYIVYAIWGLEIFLFFAD